MNKPLYIATPCSGGLLHQGYVTSLLGLSTTSFPIHVELYGGGSLVSRARNILVSKFLKSSAANLLFVDADISGFTVPDITAMIDGPRIQRVLSQKGIGRSASL